jgi:G protein beta subunit-like protein
MTPEIGASIQHVDIDSTGQMASAVTNTGSCFISSGGQEDWTLMSLFKTTSTPAMDKINAHKKYALKCKFSPDSKMMVTTSADQTAKLWDTEKRELISVSINVFLTVSIPGDQQLWNHAHCV